MSTLDSQMAATLAAYAARTADALDSAVSVSRVKLAGDAASALVREAVAARLHGQLFADIEELGRRAGGPFADADDRSTVAAQARGLARRLRSYTHEQDLRVPRASIPDRNRDDPFAQLPTLEVDELRHATAGQRALIAIDGFVGETMNGGMEQFFTNSSGDLWAEAVAGAEHIGWPELANVIRQAAERLPGSAPAPDAEKRVAQVEDLGEAPFRDLEDRLDALFETTPYQERLLAYVEAHPEEYFLPES